MLFFPVVIRIGTAKCGGVGTANWQSDLGRYRFHMFVNDPDTVQITSTLPQASRREAALPTQAVIFSDVLSSIGYQKLAAYGNPVFGLLGMSG